MMQKPRDRRLSDRDLFLRQSIFEFGQRDVRLLRYQLPSEILVGRRREVFVAAEFGRADAARLPVKLEEADDRADAPPALLRGFRDRGPALDRLDHTPTQIRRIWLRHSCRPPPSRKLESYSRRYGNPRFSLSGKRSNVRIRGSWNIFAISPAFLPGFSLPAHSSRFSWRRPQCVSLRDGLNSRWTCRFSALRMPMRAIMVGPLSSTTRSRASTADCHSSSSCSALGSFW